MSSGRSPEMEAMLEMLAGNTYGRSRYGAFRELECISCDRDCSKLEGIDMKEYKISALCPECFERGCPKEEE